MSAGSIRKCVACGESKPLEAFPKAKGRAEGRRQNCKACHNAARRATWASRPDVRRAKHDYYALRLEQKREWHRKHYKRNRERKAAYKKERRRLHPGKVREAERQNHLRHRDKRLAQRKRHRQENLEQSKERVRADYAKHADARRAAKAVYREKNRAETTACVARWREANREIDRSNAKAWRAANPAWVKQQQAKRRARKRNAATDNDRVAYAKFIEHVRTSERLSCHWCGKPTKRVRRHIDHIVPLAKGGADDVYNLCCSCPTCNSQKHAKLPEQWAGQFELNFCGK